VNTDCKGIFAAASFHNLYAQICEAYVVFYSNSSKLSVFVSA